MRKKIILVVGVGTLVAVGLLLWEGNGSPPASPPARALRGDIKVIDRISLKTYPSQIAISSGGVLVAHFGGRAIDLVDPKSGTVTREFGADPTYDGPLPTFVTASSENVFVVRSGSVTNWTADGRRRLGKSRWGARSAVVNDTAYGGGWLWIAAREKPESFPPSGGNSVLKLDPRTLRTVETHQTSAPTTLDSGYGSLWVGINGRKDGLLVIDEDTGDLAMLPELGPVRDVAVGAGGVWVYEAGPNGVDGDLIKIDPNTLETSLRMSIGGQGATLAASDTEVWAVWEGIGEADVKLLRFDGRTGEKASPTFDLPGSAFEIRAAFGSLWMTDGGRRKLFKLKVE